MADASSTVERLHQDIQETSTEADARRAAHFDDVEGKLLQRWGRAEVGHIDTATALLGLSNPFAKAANPKDNKVWVLDNTAYRPVQADSNAPQPWQAEFVACFFHTGRTDIGRFVSNIADQIGLDGKVGPDDEALQRIEERLQPLVDAIAPARSIDVSIASAGNSPQTRKLGPSNSNGISSQTVLTGGGDDATDGTIAQTTSVDNLFPSLSAQTYYADPEGWAVISDIDDTIKITHTTDPIATLRTTFAEAPQPTPGMPEFYNHLQTTLKSPAWFYLSASPYNLYPFLHTFVHATYPPGTIILRDSSWMVLGGLLKSLTQGTQAYKADRGAKIHGWLPRRKFVCVGDSTQSDPEAYAELYKRFPGWVRAIYIRKVEGEPHMEEKNKEERFERAFRDVPGSVWRVFTDPGVLRGHVEGVVGAVGEEEK